MTYTAFNAFTPGLKVYGEEGSYAQEILGHGEDIIFIVGVSSAMLEDMKNEPEPTTTPDGEVYTDPIEDAEDPSEDIAAKNDNTDARGISKPVVVIISVACAAVIAAVVIVIIKRKKK